MKGFSTTIVPMPRHHLPDTVITKSVNGKLVDDTVWHKVPDFELTNQLGQKVNWESIGDKIVVASFFFTRCPTICPRMTVHMKKLQDGVSNGQRAGTKDAKFIQFLSFSVDPERDSVKDLKNWADRFQINPSNWSLLTGDKKTIYDLANHEMRVLAVDGKGIDTSFIHTDRFVLIDRNRNVRGYYHGLDTADMEELSRDMVLLSMEKDPKRKKFYEGKLELIAVVFLVTLFGVGLLVFLFKKDKERNVSSAS
jgi:protein SCO1/2